MSTQVDEIKNQECPICRAKELTLREEETEISYFGKVFLFSMNCSACKYSKSDVESAEKHEPCKLSINIEKEDDMKIRVVKSGDATIKFPRIGSIECGPDSDGYVTNIEGLLTRIKDKIEFIKNESDEKTDIKKAKNLLKKITKIMWGQEPIKLTIEDPSGNSAIISDKTVISKL